MASQRKKRCVIAYQTRHESEVVNIFKCGDCQYYFPSLQTIHNHFISCVANLKSSTNKDQTLLDEPNGGDTTKEIKTSDRNLPMQYNHSNGTINNLIDVEGMDDLLHESTTKNINVTVNVEGHKEGYKTFSDENMTKVVNVTERSHPKIEGSSHTPKTRAELLDTSNSSQSLQWETSVYTMPELVNISNDYDLQCNNVSPEVSTKSGYFSNESNIQLENPHEDALNESVKSDDTFVRFSQTRKRKRDDNLSDNISIYCPTSTWVIETNMHSSEKYAKLDEASSIKNSIRENSETKERNLTKNAEFEHEMISQIYSNSNSYENSIPSIVHPKVETVNEIPIEDHESAKIENENKTYIHDNLKLLTTSKVSTKDENTLKRVTKEVAITALKESSVSSYSNGKEDGSTSVETSIELFNSTLFIKCEETGNCVAQVDLLSQNGENRALSSKEPHCTNKKENKVKAQSENNIEEINMNQVHQISSNQNRNSNIDHKTRNKSKLIEENKSRVLISYDDIENTDLNLECEENVTESTTKNEKRQEELKSQESYSHDKSETSKTIKLKRLSVSLKRLDVPGIFKNNISYCINMEKPGELKLENSSESVSEHNTISKDSNLADDSNTISEDGSSTADESFTLSEDGITTGDHGDDSNTLSEDGSTTEDDNKTLSENGSTESNNKNLSKDSNLGSKEKCQNCNQCNKRFELRNCYINHLILFHHPAYTRQHLTICPICPKKRYDSYFNCNLKSHVQFAHGLDEMKCLRCKTKFETYVSLDKHVKVCKAGLPQRALNKESYLYTKRVHCRLCKTFHIYRPSKHSSAIQKDIIQTLPGDQEVKLLQDKNEKLLTNTAQYGKLKKDRLKCKLCKIDFDNIRCAVNHAIVAHMRYTMKTKCKLLFKMTIFRNVCDICNNRHNVSFKSAKKMKILLSSRSLHFKEDYANLNDSEKNILQMIRDGLNKYFGYKISAQCVENFGDHFCKECDCHVGQFLCSLNHMIVKHFDREKIDMAMKTCLFNRRSKKCSKCKKIHYFTVPDVRKLKHCLAYGSYENKEVCNNTKKENNQIAEYRYVKILKNLQEILSYERRECLTENQLKTKVNVVSARTRGDISKDMKNRIAEINGTFICRLCHLQYSQYSCCKSHVMTEHSTYFRYKVGSEVYICQVCRTYFHTLYFLDIHLEKCHGIYKFTCLKCDKIFNTYNEYVSHLKHGKSYIKTNIHEKLSCKECGAIHNCAVQTGEEEMISSSPSSANDHVFKNIRTKTTEPAGSNSLKSVIAEKLGYGTDSYSDVAFDGKNFVCLVCLQKFEELRCCFSHVVIQHYQTADYTCKLCEYNTRYISAYLSHLNANHKLHVYYCRQCFLGFDDVVLRNSHAKDCKQHTTKTPDNIDKNICQKCFGVHVNVSDSDNGCSCEECELGFPSIGCAKNHYYTKHFPTWVILANTKNAFKCKCGKVVLTKAELMLHLKDYCSNASASEQGGSLKTENNQILQSSDNERIFKNSYDKCVACHHVHIVDSKPGKAKKRIRTRCKMCGKLFSNVACLQNHELSVHTNANQSWQCIGCGLYFADLKVLKLHQNGNTAGNPNSVTSKELNNDMICQRNVSLVPCNECEEIHQHKFFMEENTLEDGKSPGAIKEERHKHIQGLQKVYKCSTCDLAVTSHRDLVSHRSSMHGKMKDEQGVVCQICNKQLNNDLFYSEHLLQDHFQLQIVQGEILEDHSQAFSCGYCKEIFPFIMDVQMHLRLKHFEKPLVAKKHYRPDLDGELSFKGARIIQCPICLKLNLSSRSTARSHIKLHFEKDLEKGKSKNTYVCDICGKGYVSKYGLDNHKHRHSSIRKFQCHVCNKTFQTDSNLQTHSLVHKEKREMCKVCMMKFTLPHHVRAHMKRKHPDHQ